MKTRLKEHSADIHHGRIKQSAITEHSHASKGSDLFGRFESAGKNPALLQVKNKRGFGFETFNNKVNRDDGLKLKEAWKPVVHHIKTN